MEREYQVLAAALLPSLRPGWKTASIEGSVSDDHTDLQFAQSDGSVSVETFVPEYTKRMAARESLKAIRKTMQQDGRAPWSHFVFTMRPEGNFKFDVSYDD